MSDFLLELRSEEIPARMQAGARAELEKLFAAQMGAAGLSAAAVIVYSTPRRLTLIARGLPAETKAVSEEVKGPRTSAPPQALEGFLRKTGLTQNQLQDRDGTWFAVIDKPGRATLDVLAEAIPAIIRAFSWPKSMRWGAASSRTESLRWVRPLSGIVALFGDTLVPCEVDGIASGVATRGHRFHCPGDITIGSAGDYAEKLRACHVIVDQDERAAIIRDGAAKAAADAGLLLVPDEGLVIENAGLTEWPVPLIGRFDTAFLEVPPEVIQLTARVNQKYFVVNDSAGKLTNAFVCTANIAAKDGGAAIVAGNEKVLAARLSDARFFWDQDRKTPLVDHAKKLERITFHEKLGTVADKVDRVAKLARWLVEQGIVSESPLPFRGGGGCRSDTAPADSPHPNPSPEGEGLTLAALAEQAARLCKADLVTEMVGEFPELQGVMGGYYARAEGLDPQVADAIRDHYKPVGQGDDVPTAPVTVAVALADKLDSLCQFFLIEQAPTGSKDPFALRRAALAVISTIIQNNIRVSMEKVLLRAVDDDLDKFEKVFFGHMEKGLANFFADRLKVQQREAGVRHDLIDAVFALGGEDDLVRLLARVKALQAFMATDDGANLLAGYKRAANLLKQAGGSDDTQSRHAELGSASMAGSWTLKQVQGDERFGAADTALLTALDTAEPAAASAVADERFTDAMTALASLRTPIDAFFEGVMVNDPDPEIRVFRLGLLARFRDAVHAVADFSKIEG